MASTPGNAVLSGIEIRTATCQDLPKIHGLVRDSFASMETHTPGTSIPWDTWASDLIAAELYEADFKRIYLEPEDNNFWVAESGELGGVVGCVGVGALYCPPGRLSPSVPRCTADRAPLLLSSPRAQVKRLNIDDSKLVRMSVAPRCRGAGIGRLLVDALVSFCRAQGVLRLRLTTGNPDAARFYSRHGFLLAARSPPAIFLCASAFLSQSLQ